MEVPAKITNKSVCKYSGNCVTKNVQKCTHTILTINMQKCIIIQDLRSQNVTDHKTAKITKSKKSSDYKCRKMGKTTVSSQFTNKTS